MLTTLALAAVAAVEVEAQHLSVELDPQAQLASVSSALTVNGSGVLDVELTADAVVTSITVDGDPIDPVQRPGRRAGVHTIAVGVPEGARTVQLVYEARFDDDVEAGEQPGVIHNFSVHTHVGMDGVFLSDESAWHPRPLDDDGRPMLHVIRAAIAPIPEWSFVASGSPLAHGRPAAARAVWQTPRPVSGCALVGNRHEVIGRVHETSHGPVEIVVHVAPPRRDKAAMFLDAAAEYLDIYTPLLGAFPYSRFSIVENFFSSGFAFPGFTTLGPQVVGMAPRSLAPGYLDHELLHNWWGNGVYVDDTQGNWCEALTSYCANYYRRIADDGEDAGRDYRLGTLMKLSADPETLDDGPLAAFGSADPSRPGSSRFVGYDKGAFVFIMLERLAPDRDATWTALRRLAESHLGRRATWSDVQAAYEAALGRPLDGFFDRWVRGHTVPRTPTTADPGALAAFETHFAGGPGVPVVRDGDFIEIDPDFTCYRVLPADQIVPLIGGTLGPGGVRVETSEDRDEVESYLPQLAPDDDGANLALIGAAAIRAHADLLARTGDPLTLAPDDAAFTVGGRTYGGPEQAVLHTMVHPDHPGRFITVFHSNGDAGWQKLRLIAHYRRDTTIVFEGAEVLERRTFEPDRRIRTAAGESPRR